jgi:LEA14-like dessication related protein
MVSIRAVAPVIAFSLLSACAYTHLRQPELAIIEVNMLKGDLFSQELRVRMRVHNPNDIALPVRGIHYEVELAGSKFAHGDSTSDFVVPANGDTEFDVRVSANAAGALVHLLADGNTTNPEYRISGKVQLSSGLLRNIPFEQTGTLKLR